MPEATPEKFSVLDTYNLTHPDLDYLITWQARKYDDGTYSVWIADPAPRKLHDSLNAEHAETDARIYAEVAETSYGGVLTRNV